MNVLEALRDDHEVTLPTLTEPNLDELNAYFNTDVRDIVVERAGVLALWLHERYGLGYYILQNALLGRYARSRSVVRTTVPDRRHRTDRAPAAYKHARVKSNYRDVNTTVY